MHQAQVITVRFADTGHFHVFERVDSIDTLQQLIQKQLKIEIADQKLISKSGHVVSASNPLDVETTLDKTYQGDPLNKTTSMMKEPVVYLYNLRNLMKKKAEPAEIKEVESESYSVLQKMRETCLKIRQNIFELKPLSETLSESKFLKLHTYNPQVVEMADSWRKTTLKFVDNFSSFKENKYCLDNYFQMIENQRKGINILIKNLKNSSEFKFSVYKKLQAQFEQVQKASAETEVKETDTRQISQFLLSVKRKLINCRTQINKNRQKIHDFKTENKKLHSENQAVLKGIDGSMSKFLKQLDGYLKQMKDSYINLIEAIVDKFDKANEDKLIILLDQRKRLEEKFAHFVQTSAEAITHSEKNFVDIYSIEKKNEMSFREEFKKYYEMSIQEEEVIASKIQEIESWVHDLSRKIKSLQAQIKPQQVQMNKAKAKLSQNWVASEPILKNKVSSQHSQNSCRSGNASIENNVSSVSAITNKNNENNSSVANLRASATEREDKELIRRKYFNKKLTVLNEELKLILKEEQTARKLFIAEQISHNQFYHHAVLENINVPCFLLNFDETTDKEILSNLTLSKSGVGRLEPILEKSQVDLSFFHSSVGMDRVLQELDIIRNCQINLKKECGAVGKIKNLQTIIEKSADVFHHVYTQKIAQVEKKHENRERHLQFRIGNLERENSELHAQLNSLSEKQGSQQSERTWLEQKVSNLMSEIDEMRGQNYQQMNKNKEETEKLRIENRQLQKYLEEAKKKEGQLKVDQKQLQKKITEQIAMIQPLVQELQESSLHIKQIEDLNVEYKYVMGDQQVRIASLEAELASLGASGSQGKLQESFYGQHLKQGSNKKPKEEDDDRVEPDGDRMIEEPESGLEKQQKVQVANQCSMRVKKYQDSVYDALEMEISCYKQQIEDLKAENDSLNEELMKIAMKDTEDTSIQTEAEEPSPPVESNTVFNSSGALLAHQYAISQYEMPNLVVTVGNPRQGQLRLFIPYESGVYVVASSRQNIPSMNQFTSYETSNRALRENSENSYTLDLGCLSLKAQQLLKQM